MNSESVLVNYSILHNVYYSAKEMAQIFDNQYFNSKRYKLAAALDINTDLVVHSNELKHVYKTLLFKMRNIAKQNFTSNESTQNKKPRISFCGYSVTANDNLPINFCKSTTGKYFFNGLANCGGYWRCPVCAVKISEEKKEFIAGLISSHQALKKRIGFITLTVRHNKNNTLNYTLEKLTNNYRKFQSTRWYKENFKPGTHLIGQIKTLEITYSHVNGWHPHLHILHFYDTDTTNDNEIIKFQNTFIEKWASYLDNDGLKKSQNQQILTSDVSDYVAKYDICMEMTKGQIKSSKGLTPFTALAKLALKNYDTIEERNRLFSIYSTYVEFTQGKHFVNISNSLRKIYPDNFIDEKTDEEIVNNTEIDEILFKISVNTWKLICKNDLQPLILNQYEKKQLDSVYYLLKTFKDFESLEIEIEKDLPILKTKKDYEKTTFD